MLHYIELRIKLDSGENGEKTSYCYQYSIVSISKQDVLI